MLKTAEYDRDHLDEEWFGSDYEDYYSIDSLLEQEYEDRISGE